MPIPHDAPTRHERLMRCDEVYMSRHENVALLQGFVLVILLILLAWLILTITGGAR